jgi:transglutaminase-like putative cysteine protease
MRTLGAWPSDHGPSVVVDFVSIDEQLRFLRKMVDQFRQAPQIRDLAVQIITSNGVASRDKKEQAKVIAQWVMANIYYVHELPERFQLPTETLRLKAGDCDDATTLTASLLESVGIPSVLVCMSLNGVWVHIFPAAVMSGGKLLHLDTTAKSRDLTRNPVAGALAKGKRVSLKIA